MKAAATQRLRWTVRDYFRMAKADLFHGRRVELINGEVVEVQAQANPHRTSVTKITRLLLSAFGPSDWVVIQGTLVLPPHGAPDPDFHVLDVPEGTPDDRLPLPILVIEVCDTTYLRDSGPKLRMYARAGIEDYWIVNIPERRVEVYRRPEQTTAQRSRWGYGEIRMHNGGDQVPLLKRPSIALPVDGMLP